MTLHAVPPPVSPVFRVARGNDAPPLDAFAPPAWGRAAADGTFGNRFDDPGKADGIPDGSRFRVLYCATQREGAFAETIAHFRPDLAALAALDGIAGEAGEQRPAAGMVPARWRRVRGVGEMRLDPALRFADVAHPDTLAELRVAFARLAAALGYSDFDLSTVTGHRRILTQRVARYVYEQTTGTGVPTFAGIRYVSRHNPVWECWAIFANRLAGERRSVQAIASDDAGLVVAATHLGLTIEGDPLN